MASGAVAHLVARVLGAIGSGTFYRGGTGWRCVLGGLPSQRASRWRCFTGSWRGFIGPGFEAMLTGRGSGSGSSCVFWIAGTARGGARHMTDAMQGFGRLLVADREGPAAVAGPDPGGRDVPRRCCGPRFRTGHDPVGAAWSR